MRGFGVRKGVLSVFIVAVLLLVATPLQASAADFNLTASPLPINLTTKPGQAVSTQLRVENTGTQTVTINVSLKKFGPTDNTGKPTILDPEAGDDFIKWVHFSETAFTAEPNVWHTITMTINPPPGSAFGYYYAVIFSHADGQAAVVSNTLHSTVKGAIASLVLLDVNAPGEKRQLKTTSFTSQHEVYEYLPASFTVTVHNSGNVHAVPAGDIFVTRGGKNIATLELNNAHGNVLPNTDRQFEVQWSDGFPSFTPKKINGQVVSNKDGSPKLQLNWNGGKFDFTKFRFGKYHAHLVMTYNDGARDVPVEGDLAFWVVPWKLILVIIVLIVIRIRWRAIKRFAKAKFAELRGAKGQTRL